MLSINGALQGMCPPVGRPLKIRWNGYPVRFTEAVPRSPPASRMRISAFLETDGDISRSLYPRPRAASAALISALPMASTSAGSLY